ncbi:MAG: glycoside hydrolase family 57 protein [Methanospirillaceae archaeon]|nr:glycoside hydrolase family 57 protein [Methanospirillaceae archaeon]
MPDICIGFEVHQPFRLNTQFHPDPGIPNSDLFENYCNDSTHINQKVLERVSHKCYIPATETILENLDEGFHCSFSLSGTLVEQLQRWNTDVLSLFENVASHKNTEILSQTYYHSIAGCFYEKAEFEEQVRMHQDLMHDLFGVVPRIFENTEFTFNNEIARHVRDLGFKGIFTEGVSRILGWRSPHYLYSCNDLPVFMRNVQLSDDIAFRFANTSWDMYPLMADSYADWLATSSGELITIFIDYETFGEHFWKETGIFNFLRSLPQEMNKRGIKTILPSEAVQKYHPMDSIDVPHTISWADIEKDTSAWLGNDRQLAAFSAVESARFYPANKTVWRYLTTSDHFYYMASKYGTCGEVHTYFSHQCIDEAFKTYMSILSDYEERSLPFMKNEKAARILRVLPPEKAFHFSSPAGYIGYSAYNLDQFCELLPIIPMDSLEYHLKEGHISRWIREVLGDDALADEIGGYHERHEIAAIVSSWRDSLWTLVG